MPFGFCTSQYLLAVLEVLRDRSMPPLGSDTPSDARPVLRYLGVYIPVKSTCLGKRKADHSVIFAEMIGESWDKFIAGKAAVCGCVGTAASTSASITIVACVGDDRCNKDMLPSEAGEFRLVLSGEIAVSADWGTSQRPMQAAMVQGADTDDAQNEVAMAAANDQGDTNLNESAERAENEDEIEEEHRPDEPSTVKRDVRIYLFIHLFIKN